jgi:hypothetical protein
VKLWGDVAAQQKRSSPALDLDPIRFDRIKV